MTAPTAEEARLSDSRFRVIKTLGAGAGSTIRLVEDVATRRRYALKVVERTSPDQDIYVAQALHEFQVAKKLKHPNLLRIFDCRVRRSWFRVAGVDLLMEYVDGAALDGLRRELDVGQVVLVAVAVASALEHMHRRGVFHGDLKPSNIMLGVDGSVKVIDFGTAWLKGSPKDRIQGTPEYMAPEQSREIVDARTDLFNLGATLYRLLTGQFANSVSPHEVSDELGARLNRVAPPIELNPSIPGTLNETIMACLRHDAGQRPAGAFEVRAQLGAVARYLRIGPGDLAGIAVVEG